MSIIPTSSAISSINFAVAGNYVKIKNAGPPSKPQIDEFVAKEGKNPDNDRGWLLGKTLKAAVVGGGFCAALSALDVAAQHYLGGTTAGAIGGFTLAAGMGLIASFSDSQREFSRSGTAALLSCAVFSGLGMAAGAFGGGGVAVAATLGAVAGALIAKE